jgi:hypothetical protein
MGVEAFHILLNASTCSNAALVGLRFRRGRIRFRFGFAGLVCFGRVGLLGGRGSGLCLRRVRFGGIPRSGFSGFGAIAFRFVRFLGFVGGARVVDVPPGTLEHNSDRVHQSLHRALTVRANFNRVIFHRLKYRKFMLTLDALVTIRGQNSHLIVR